MWWWHLLLRVTQSCISWDAWAGPRYSKERVQDADLTAPQTALDKCGSNPLCFDCRMQVWKLSSQIAIENPPRSRQELPCWGYHRLSCLAGEQNVLPGNPITALSIRRLTTVDATLHCNTHSWVWNMHAVWLSVWSRLFDLLHVVGWLIAWVQSKLAHKLCDTTDHDLDNISNIATCLYSLWIHAVVQSSFAESTESNIYTMSSCVFMSTMALLSLWVQWLYWPYQPKQCIGPSMNLQ